MYIFLSFLHLDFKRNYKQINENNTQSNNSFSFENKSCSNLNKNIILVVDDNHLINEANKNIVKKWFNLIGIEVEIILCSDGIDIIRYVLNDKIKKNIKCILTDENMEFINGSEAIKLIRKLESKSYIPHIPCISVTCHEDKNIVDNIYASGANRVLSKPLNMPKLTSLLQDLEL